MHAMWLMTVLLAATPVDGNRLAYLDGHDIYYPHKNFPKLITPQWVGDEGVEAVVILAIDDMREPPKYEAYLRPILQRLKQIDGRAPVSIMTCAVKPDDPQLQEWLKEGLSLEVHTFDHPCPLLQGGDFAKAKGTYDKCVDLLFSVPNNAPVAYRMPCCDSLNTVSPRFYKEIFNKTTPNGKFLQISSSVFQVFTADDPTIPPELLFDADGKERFRKYFPKGLKRGDQTHDRFVNYIENYPYPYVIDRLCWEFPCMTPSDWEANFLHQPNNPQTVEDLKAALDITVHKKGVLNLVFHPHGWIKAEQVNELIDHAVAKHGGKVKFLTFKEALERLNKNVLAGQPLRNDQGSDNLVRVVDLNWEDSTGEDGDWGHLDMVRLHPDFNDVRVWDKDARRWKNSWNSFQRKVGDSIKTLEGRILSWPPMGLIQGQSGNNNYLGLELRWYGPPQIAFFGTQHGSNSMALQFRLGEILSAEQMDFEAARFLLLNDSTLSLLLQPKNVDSLVIVPSILSDEPRNLTPPCHLDWSPPGIRLCGPNGADAGLRFVDVNEDGTHDLVYSDHQRYGIWLFDTVKTGWSIELISGQRGDKHADQELPPIVRADGTDNGFFVRDRALHWMNEDTAHLPNLIVSWDFDKLLGDRIPAAKTPKAALDSMRPRPGFTVELMAHEPLTMDPVAMQWGPDGKLWIAEMADYPNGMDGRGQPGGRVRFLEDTDGDGQYDKSTLFLDGVPFPSGVHPWKNGVLVSAAPDVFFAADTDGDWKADVREVLYTGFGEGNQQHRINGFSWGLDGWLYLANGDSGGQIRSVKTGETLELRGRDLRIHPETGRMDAVTGSSQFGINRDDWGNWFGNNNSRPLYHYVLDDVPLRRNPHVSPPDPRRDVSVQPGNAPIFPASKTLTRFNDFHTANHFTSACSAIVYRDDVLLRAKGLGLRDREEPSDSVPQPLALSPQLTFVSEPVHNLVHCEVMKPKGLTFTSQRLDDEQQSEFLASTDNWFRPTQLRVGPDGALWIADMYRLVIEHPQWIPQEWQEKLDVRAGEDKGRLWRVYPQGAKLRPVPRLDRLSDVVLVAAMDSPSGWQRDTVQQLLIERLATSTPAARKQPGCFTALAALVKNSTRPEVRVQALWTLHNLQDLSAAVLMPALNDTHPGVRRNAVRVCGGLAKTDASVLAAVLKLVDDPEPTVRLELAYLLGDLNEGHPETLGALGQLAATDLDDPYLRAAIWSSVNQRSVPAVTWMVLSTRDGMLPANVWEQLIAQAVGFRNDAAVAALSDRLLTERPTQAELWRLKAVDAFLTALERRGDPWAKWSRTADDSTAALRQRWQNWLDGAVAGVRDAERAPELRAATIALCRHLDGVDLPLEDWLKPTQPPVVQLAAVQLIAQRPSPSRLQSVIAQWRMLSPQTRQGAIEGLVRQTDFAKALLEQIRSGELTAADLDATARQRLLEHPRPEIRTAAHSVLGSLAGRQEVVQTYLPHIRGGGDAERGAAIFRKSCSTCHKLGDVGHAVGPDLASLADKSAESLLTAILDPNRAVESKYWNYSIVTEAGRTLQGIIASETATSLELLAAEGKRETLLRSEIDEFNATAKSLMPEGLEKDFTPEQVADLIAWLRTTVPDKPRKTFPGNEPRPVVAEANGQFVLTPATCEIYGPTIVLEEEHGNLGWWSSADDYVIWTLDVAHAGEYRVTLDYACEAGAARHRLVIDGGRQPLVYNVAPTAGWDDYRAIDLGVITLDAGPQRLKARPAERPLPALLDLKSIRLTPVTQ